MHFRQLVRSSNFEQFNHGPAENTKRYGHPDVRSYDFDRIKVPVALICGKTDLLAPPGNYLWLRDKLERNEQFAGFREYELGHMGLIMPNNRSIFNDMLKFMIVYNTEGD